MQFGHPQASDVPPWSGILSLCESPEQWCGLENVTSHILFWSERGGISILSHFDDSLKTGMNYPFNRNALKHTHTHTLVLLQYNSQYNQWVGPKCISFVGFLFSSLFLWGWSHCAVWRAGKKKQTLPRLISFLCLIRMIHSSLHIENLLKTNNAAKIAAQEIRKTNTRGTWESGWAGLNPTACCILPIFGSSCLFTATRKTNSTFYDITKGCTAFRASVWTLCFFLLFVCFSSMCLHVWLHSCSKRLPGFRVQRSGAAHFICTADAANQSQAFFICSESVVFCFFFWGYK